MVYNCIDYSFWIRTAVRDGNKDQISIVLYHKSSRGSITFIFVICVLFEFRLNFCTNFRTTNRLWVGIPTKVKCRSDIFYVNLQIEVRSLLCMVR